MDLADHVAVPRYTAGRTDRMLAELIAAGRTQMGLCAWDDVVQDPVPGLRGVSSVGGDLTRSDVMIRAGVGRARTVVVDGRDDNENLAIVAAVDHANPEVHVVAALRGRGDTTVRELLAAR